MLVTPESTCVLCIARVYRLAMAYLCCWDSGMISVRYPAAFKSFLFGLLGSYTASEVTANSVLSAVTWTHGCRISDEVVAGACDTDGIVRSAAIGVTWLAKDMVMWQVQ